MKKFSFSGSEDYLALVTRRKWWAIVPFLVLSAAFILVARLLTSVYVSETLILVAPELHGDFVKDLVNVSMERRLREIQEAVLSRTNLLRIITEFENGLTGYRGLDDEKRVAAFKSDIDIEFQTERGAGSSILGFRISYQNQDPVLAQKITSRLASLFIEYDNRNRGQVVSGTTEFLNNELQKRSEELAQADQVVKTVKERYRYELPEQADTNLRALDRLEAQTQTNTGALDRFVSLRLSIERQISETPQTITEPSADRGPYNKAGATSLVSEYKTKERTYRELTSKYKEGHPDVQRLKAELDHLKTEIPSGDLIDKPESSLPTTVTKPNPVYQNLVAQLREVKTEIGIRERERKWLQDEIGKYSQRLQNVPQREQEIASVTRIYDESKKQYDDLETKLAQAKLAASLEQKQKGAQFTIVDPASLPIRPSKPNRLKIMLIGLTLSLALGIAVAGSVDLLDQKLWTQAEVERLLGVPVLIEVPEILSEQETSHQRKKTLIRVLALVACSMVFVVTVYLLYVTPAVKVLIERYLNGLSKL